MLPLQLIFVLPQLHDQGLSLGRSQGVVGIQVFKHFLQSCGPQAEVLLELTDDVLMIKGLV